MLLPHPSSPRPPTRLTAFLPYLVSEMKALNDSTLQQEADLLEKLIDLP